ncbi:hypothetical protein QF026_007537 [Streptomyces aurantiacus]|nr:hypothetical protein [Streptomyces aurantiacus]MDQ0779071.1 hypothetical protein [Streptomyces aurantiacus]
MGFRLVQHLRLGWMSPRLVYQQALFRETVRHPPAVQNVHTVSLCTRTGRIRGCISLGCSQDPLSMPLDHPGRGRFSTEAAHNIDLLGRFAADGVGTHQAFEIKRFVRDLDLPPGPGTERVSWHLLLGLGRAICQAGDRMRVLLGDAKENVAIRHFRLTGFDLQIDRGTTPRLPDTDLMAPIYHQAVTAVPFVAPVHADLGDYMDHRGPPRRRPGGTDAPGHGRRHDGPQITGVPHEGGVVDERCTDTGAGGDLLRRADHPQQGRGQRGRAGHAAGRDRARRRLRVHRRGRRRAARPAGSAYLRAGRPGNVRGEQPQPAERSGS